MNDAIREVLEFGWPVRQTRGGAPMTLDLKTAARWATAPVDMTAVEVHERLAMRSEVFS